MRSVVLAPFSNSTIRDWPLQHFRMLTALLLQDAAISVTIVGTAGQWVMANELVRAHAPDRARNGCGYMLWSEVLEAIGSAELVVANNSGLAHVAGRLGSPTLCVFGASHSPYEWMPRGRRVTVMTKQVECSPCGLDHTGACPFGVRCLSEILPEQVHGQCRRLLAAAETTPS